jgi:hypothetical protein
MPAIREIRNRGYYTDIQQSHGDQLIAPHPEALLSEVTQLRAGALTVPSRR